MKIKATKVPYSTSHQVTVGKAYELTEDKNSPNEVCGFTGEICADDGEVLYILENNCAHLEGGSWSKV